MVNSGTAANTLALASLQFEAGTEIITPALTFSTTVAPMVQQNLVPVFVDAESDTYNIDANQIEKMISPKTKAIMIPNLIGNLPDWSLIRSIADQHGLKVIEDSADTIGYKINNHINSNNSDIVTNSFYASHIISGAGFGGIVCFEDNYLYKRAKLLRGWGRSSAVFDESESIKKRFNVKISGIQYDRKYIFSELGYNFLPSEISAAFALEQLKKLKKNISIREKNFNHLLKFFSKYVDYFKLPEVFKNVKTPWLAFPLVIKKNKKFNRMQFQIFFEKNNIQTRTIFTGNILRQPIMKNLKYKKHQNSEKNSDDVMENGILIGCHQGLFKNDLIRIEKVFEKFAKEKHL